MVQFFFNNVDWTQKKSQMDLGSKFWGMCVPARITIALIVWFIPTVWLPAAGIIALVGVGWLVYRFATFDSTQVGVFKQPVTWNFLRPMHAAVWSLFAYLALTKNTHAKFFPFADVVLGAAVRAMRGATHV
jgi:hypothetical protein